MGFWSGLAKDIGKSALLAANGLNWYDGKNDRELIMLLKQALSRRDKNEVNKIVEKLNNRGYETELLQALTMSDGMDYLEQIEDYCDRELFDLDDLIIEAVVAVHEGDILSALCVGVAMYKYMQSITSAKELSEMKVYAERRKAEVARIRYSNSFFIVSNEEIALKLAKAMKEGDKYGIEYGFKTLKESRALNRKEIFLLLQQFEEEIWYC